MQLFCSDPKVHFLLTSHLPDTKQKNLSILIMQQGLLCLIPAIAQIHKYSITPAFSNSNRKYSYF